MRFEFKLNNKANATIHGFNKGNAIRRFKRFSEGAPIHFTTPQASNPVLDLDKLSTPDLQKLQAIAVG